MPKTLITRTGGRTDAPTGRFLRRSGFFARKLWLYFPSYPECTRTPGHPETWRPATVGPTAPRHATEDRRSPDHSPDIGEMRTTRRRRQTYRRTRIRSLHAVQPLVFGGRLVFMLKSFPFREGMLFNQLVLFLYKPFFSCPFHGHTLLCEATYLVLTSRLGCRKKPLFCRFQRGYGRF